MARYRAVRGTFDLLPKQMPAWAGVENTARELAHRFGFREIRTPLFEHAELFTRGLGVMSGLIEKELWTFQDKFGQKLALRADMTSGVIRAFQENKLYEGGLPQKMFYLAPVFLLGKEGEERSRQSHQFGFEALGSDNAALDAEVIALAAAFCDAVGLEGYSIRLNSLGGSDCRPQYQQKLRDYFGAHSEQLCATCKRKFKAHPDWVLSCEEEGCKQLSQVAPTIYGMLSNGAKQHFAALREYLEEMELPVELDPRVVRDSEYYNRTVFEVRHGDKSLGFGGRYDGLVEKLGGKSTPAVGFSFSMEALIDALGDRDSEFKGFSPVVYFQPEGPESSKLLVPMMNALRQRGVSAELDYRNGGRSAQKAPEGCSYVVILDESNAFRGHAVLKDLGADKEEKVPVGRLRARVLHLAGGVADAVDRDSGGGRKRLKRGVKRRDEEPSERDEDSESRGSRGSRRKLRRGRSEDVAESRDGGDTPDKSEARETREPRGRGRDRDRDRDKEQDGRSRERNSERDQDKPKERGRDRDSERAERPERDKDRERNNERKPERKPRERSRDKDESEGDGKAIVPNFNLGGAPAVSTPKPPSRSAPESAAKAAARSTASVAAAPAFSLNWSILPGKESGQGNGKGGHNE